VLVNIITPISKRGFSRNLSSARSGPPSCTNSALNALSVGTNTVNGPIIEIKIIKNYATIAASVELWHENHTIGGSFITTFEYTAGQKYTFLFRTATFKVLRAFET